jgi:hypothetical protein
LQCTTIVNARVETGLAPSLAKIVLEERARSCTAAPPVLDACAGGFQELTEPEILFLFCLGQLSDLNQIDGHNANRNKLAGAPSLRVFCARVGFHGRTPVGIFRLEKDF